jgi:hypothetical protein
VVRQVAAQVLREYGACALRSAETSRKARLALNGFGFSAMLVYLIQWMRGANIALAHDLRGYCGLAQRTTQ